MKYTVEIEINKPVSRVIELFDSIDNMFKWMEGLEKFEPISGTPGQVGAKSKLTFKVKNRKMEMIEIITVKNLPKEFIGICEVKGARIIVKNFFHELHGNKTRYLAEQKFQLKGFMRCIAFLMPGMFKKQLMKHLEAFRNFVETN